MYPAIWLTIRACWAALGAFFGIYTLFKVYQNWGNLTIIVKTMWWFQLFLSSLSGLFLVWLVWTLYGFTLKIGIIAMILLIVGSFLALPSALGVLMFSRE